MPVTISATSLLNLSGSNNLIVPNSVEHWNWVYFKIEHSVYLTTRIELLVNIVACSFHQTINNLHNRIIGIYNVCLSFKILSLNC